MKQKLILPILVMLLTQAFVWLLVVSPVSGLLTTAQATIDSTTRVKTAFTQNDFGGIQSGITSLIDNTQQLSQKLEAFQYLRSIPVVSDYYSDVETLLDVANQTLPVLNDLLDKVEPYRDVLGLGTESAELKGFLTVSPQLIPILHTALTDLSPVVDKLERLHFSRYLPYAPNDVRLVIDTFERNKSLIRDYYDETVAMLPYIPELLGARTSQRYLVLFQNDKELRPTGGFISALSTVTISTGEMTIGGSENIYEIEQQGIEYAPPSPIFSYLGQTVWHLRDMNFSPDYPTSAEQFYTFWKQLGQLELDGIIAVDTQFAEEMLREVGPITIEGYDYTFTDWYGLPDACQIGVVEFTAENVVCRLEVYAEKLGLGKDERKSVIGALMQEIFTRVMDTSIEELPSLVDTVLGQLSQKHMILYFTDETIEGFAQNYNWAGEIKSFDGDYLHVNDANLGGLKSDLYVERSVGQSYEIAPDGTITKTVSLTYSNTAAYDGWLNSAPRIYTRVYVPLGSELVETEGSQATVNVTEDLGKTVFDSFIKFLPGESHTVSFTYTLPFTYSDGLTLLIQKQPGVSVRKHSIGGDVEPVSVDVVKDVEIDITKR